MSDLLTFIFLCTALIVLLGITVLIFIHLYQIFEEPKIQKQMRKLRKPVQPWVTVILYSRNNQPLVDVSLKAILRSHYHNFDVAMVDDRAGDGIKALKKAYRNSQKGEVVMSLRAGVIVPPAFIKRAVAIKGSRSQLALRISKSLTPGSLTGMFQSLNSLLWQRADKVQVSDARNITLPKTGLQLDILATLFFISVVSLSIATQEPILLWYAWLIFTSYLLAVIWLKEEKVKQKIRLSFSAISAMFYLPVANIALRLSQYYSRN